MTKRRDFIKKAAAISGGIVATTSLTSSLIGKDLPKINLILKNHLQGKIYAPLSVISFELSELANLEIMDGKGRIYYKFNQIKKGDIRVGGALGTHIIVIKDKQGNQLNTYTFNVDAATEIIDSSGTFAELINIARWSMVGRAPGMDGGGGLAAPFLVDGKFYFLFVPWLRDHVHTLKGMKYFFPDIKGAIELFAKYQREDGMIADNIYPSSKELNMWDKRFSKGGFIWRTPDYKFEFKRIPAEADMEYLFIEGLYFTWKATGDSAWMAGFINNALKAVKYNMSDPYRWSEKYGLIKRGYTIDTWDFQSDYHIEDTGKDIMVIDKDKTKFGIMYGDNTGMIASLGFLAEMLEELGRNSEAQDMKNLAKQLQEKLDKLAWNGNFYTHHVPEDTTFKPDFGVNTNEQVSLSNTYSINRGIGHDKAVQIIKTYQGIKEKKPKSAPAEWFAIYPPFEKGFGEQKWHYMNGGVVALAAGELAKGAFENGFESYGVDILQRIRIQAKENNNYIYGCYKGAMPEKPIYQKISPLDLKPYLNADVSGKGGSGVVGWTGEGENDLHEMPFGPQTYFDILFNVVDPETNSRKACLGISNTNGYKSLITIPLNAQVASFYFLQIKAGDGLAGRVQFNYTDNTSSIEDMDDSRITGWWMPSDKPNFKVAWKGKNYKAPSVGVGVCGINNPQPSKVVKEVILKTAEGSKAKWFVLAISSSDAPVYLKPNPLSTGIPDKWGAAAVMYALAEGLVGLKDNGLAYDKIIVSPRWAATDEQNVLATLKYEASGGYCTYTYKKESNVLRLEVSTNASDITMRVLLPPNFTAKKVMVDLKETFFKEEKIQGSIYAVFNIKPMGVSNILIQS